jgi:hypothetical protein
VFSNLRLSEIAFRQRRSQPRYLALVLIFSTIISGAVGVWTRSDLTALLGIALDLTSVGALFILAGLLPGWLLLRPFRSVFGILSAALFFLLMPSLLAAVIRPERIPYSSPSPWDTGWPQFHRVVRVGIALLLGCGGPETESCSALASGCRHSDSACSDHRIASFGVLRAARLWWWRSSRVSMSAVWILARGGPTSGCTRHEPLRCCFAGSILQRVAVRAGEPQTVGR